MLFYMAGFCYGGVLEHALMLGGSKIALFFTFTLLQYSPRPDTTRLVPGLMKVRLLKHEMRCDWLAVPVCCDWRTA